MHLNFNETLPFLLAQLSTYFKVQIEKQLIEFDLHHGQIFILFELWKTDGLSQIELSSAIGISPPTINKMVKSLDTSNFVVSSKCKIDGRVSRVYLTPKGVAIRPSIEEMWKNLEISLVENLTPTEQLVLSQLFCKINENLQKNKI